ncbi:MAG: efflux RND transporter periplasmic adaptor subunit [Prolixibacteraceae bacterium]
MKTTSTKLTEFIAIASIAILSACSGTRSEESQQAEKRAYVKQQNPVEVMVLENGPFKKELVNNGRLIALRKGELKFRVSEQLEEVPVRNGEHVRTGQLIASLVPFTYRQQLNSAEIKVKQSRLEMQNVLIGQGYNTLDTLQIPAHIYQMSTIKSGYADALQSLKTAEFNLESTRLIAPFGGVLANITKKKYEQVGSGDVFCTLIDDSEFEVEFKLVENEIASITQGDEVQVIPFSDAGKHYKGRITEINPLIDASGLILVKAQVKNPGTLMEGMNVKVLVEKEIPGQLVVPKSAVVLRQNQEVLFKCVSDSIAFWTYVQTVAENSSSYSVIAHPDKGGTLEPGDTVIISGNLNLAHESGVEIQ